MDLGRYGVHLTPDRHPILKVIKSLKFCVPLSLSSFLCPQDLRRLRRHFDSYEPTLVELRKKYETAMKEKMLIRLERDRVKAKVEELLDQVRQSL